MAEHLLRAEFGRRGIAATVHSSGFMSEGKSASAEGVELLAKRGIDASTHTSRATTAEMLAAADLVLAMTAEHVRNATLVNAPTFDRIFLLKELSVAVAAHPRAPGESLPRYLQGVLPDRSRADYLGVRPTLDVDDPYGRRMKAYKATLAELDEHLVRLVDGVWGSQAASLGAVAAPPVSPLLSPH